VRIENPQAPRRKNKKSSPGKEDSDKLDGKFASLVLLPDSTILMVGGTSAQTDDEFKTTRGTR